MFSTLLKSDVGSSFIKVSDGFAKLFPTAIIVVEYFICLPRNVLHYHRLEYKQH